MDEHSLVFVIENSKPAEDDLEVVSENKDRGIGLQNVIKRLQLLYADKHELKITNDSTYRVELTMNLD